MFHSAGDGSSVAFPFIAQGTVDYKVKRGGAEVFAVPPSIVQPLDSAKGMDITAPANQTSPPDDKLAVLKRIGILRGNVVYSLVVNPCHYDRASRRLTYYRKIEITLTASVPFPQSFGALSEPRVRSPGRAVRASPDKTSGTRIRIIVDRDGMYHITGSDLDTAGVVLSGLNVSSITLWNRGKQIPIYIGNPSGSTFTKGSYIEFYGTANLAGYSENRRDLYLDPYSGENVYFLTTDSTAPVQRLVTESGAIGKEGTVDLSNYSFTQTVHLERDLKHERLNAVDVNRTSDRHDHWFWTEVSSQQLVSIPFRLAYPDTTNIQSLTLTAAFQGITHFDGGSHGTPNIPNEHQAELFINRDRVLGATWDGQTSKIAKVATGANIPQSILHHGANTFQVYDANSGGVAQATLALNWVELNYQRLYMADNDYLEFTTPDNAPAGNYRFLIRNFSTSSISVYRLNNSRITDVTIKNLNVGEPYQGYAAVFDAYVQSPSERLIAVSDAGKLSPLRIEKISDAALSSRDYSADYIIIASRAIADVSGKESDADSPVNKLASWYDSHGRKTLVVNAVQVYDDFNFGIRSPYAIREFISYAYHNWSAPPKYVLLAGAGTSNTKTGSQSSNLIPVMMMQTYGFGATACDNFYACVDGDDPIPDVAIGRIPAADRDQFAAVADKILSYYSGRNYGWQNTAMMVAGDESQFHVQTDSIVRSEIPSKYFVRRLYTSIQDPAADTRYYGLTRNLVNDINDGAVLLNYMGHGGGAVWADNGILTNDEVSNLSNKGKYPFITSMTCFTGAFDGQIGLPLSSTLLFAPEKGAIGVLASAGLGWLYNDYYMVSEILPVLFDSARADYGVGLNIALAKAMYYAGYAPFWPQAESMINQYNLIGDPALVLQLPGDALTVRLDSYTPQEGHKVSGTIAGGPPGGDCVIQLTDGNGDVAARTDVKLDNNGSSSFSLAYNGGLEGRSHVKAYAYNDAAQSSASVDLSTDESFLQVSAIRIGADGNSFHVRIHGVVSSIRAAVSSVAFIGEIRAPGPVVAARPALSLNMPLRESPANEYSSDYHVSMDSLHPGDIVSGRLVAHFSDGSRDSSGSVSYIVPGAADISAFPREGAGYVNQSIEVVADSVVRLEALVYNWNSNPAENVRVDFYDGDRLSGTIVGSARVGFDTALRRKVAVPATLEAGRHTVYMYVVFDSLTDGYDLDPGDNLAYKTLNVNYVAADQDGKIKWDTVAVLSGASPGEIFRVDTLSPPLYPQMFLTLARDRNGHAGLYEFSPVTSSGARHFTVSLAIVDPDSTTIANLSAFRLYRYDARTRTLNLAGGTCAGRVVSAGVNNPGVFAAAYSSDRTPPHVTMSVGDQFFTNGDFVPPNPRFSILMHDEDAVDLQTGSINVSVDDQAVDPSMITIPDSVYNPTSVAATVQVPLKDGSHTIRFTARDASGNAADPVSADFVVRSDFSLRVFGNYPNPFVSRTFIAFEITSGNPIDAVMIKIYTVSGRLVKTIRYPSTNPAESMGLLQGGTGSPAAVGYHEAWWDGVDNFGNQVANGVYFYKVSVSSGGKTVNEIGKMARLR